MIRKAVFAAVLAVVAGSFMLAQTGKIVDLAGHSVDPFTSQEQVKVLLFARSDCPITKRYAPELHRIAQEFQSKAVVFWLVFPDPAETAADVRSLIGQYQFPGTPIFDPGHALVRRAHASVAPEASVFNGQNQLVYRGRIDDLYVDIGKSRPTPSVHDLEDAITAVLSGQAVKTPETRAVGCSLADIE